MKNLFFFNRMVIGILLAAITTYFLIVSGIDWKIAVFYNQNEFLVYLASPFVLLGMFIPLIIVGYSYFKWKKNKNDEYLIQYKRSKYSFLTAYLLMTLLKIFSNRVDMEPFEAIGENDFSNQFRFGFLNSNSLWESFSEGWPSGHTLIAVAMAIAIHPLLKTRLLKSINIIYVLLVAWSVSTAFHWFSDVISGGLLGIIIGQYYSNFQLKKYL